MMFATWFTPRYETHAIHSWFGHKHSVSAEHAVAEDSQLFAVRAQEELRHQGREFLRSIEHDLMAIRILLGKYDHNTSPGQTLRSLDALERLVSRREFDHRSARRAILLPAGLYLAEKHFGVDDERLSKALAALDNALDKSCLELAITGYRKTHHTHGHA